MALRCLVTGAPGFIGSHLCDTLLAEGHDAVFVGSSILKLYDDKEALIQKIREFKAEC